MKSKTIILSNTEEHSGRGILTLYEEDDLLKCKLRLYNLTKLDKFCKLGIYHNNQVYTANLLEKHGVYESSFVGDFNLNEDFYTAIINTNQNNKVIIAGGTYSGFCFEGNLQENVAKESILSDYVEEQNNMQNFVAKAHNLENCDENCGNCANCKYKEWFYSQNVETLPENEEKQDNLQEFVETQATIPNLVEQFDNIFENYTPDTELNNLLPNSKFVKITENNQQYSIGAMFENEKITLLCYAVKSAYNSPAPQELGPHHQWLPIDKEDPLSDGYHIVFQDAEDLSILRF